MNHAQLNSRWSADGTTLAWVIEGKWFPAAYVLIRVADDRVDWQLNVLSSVQRDILARTKEAAPDKYQAAKAQNAGNGSAFPDGFTVNINSPCDRFQLPFQSHVTLDSNPKRLNDWPPAADLQSSMEVVIDQSGQLDVSRFTVEGAATIPLPPATPATTPKPSVSYLKGERFPQTRMRVLTVPEIENWPVTDLQYAINEIFARHGAPFADPAVQKHFRQFDWYHEQSRLTYEQIEASLPEPERSNVTLLGNRRNSKNGAPLVKTDPQQNPPADAVPSPQSSLPAQVPSGPRYTGHGRVYKVPELEKLVGLTLNTAWLYGDFLFKGAEGNTGLFITTAILILPKEGNTQLLIEFTGGIQLSQQAISTLADPMLVIPVHFQQTDPMQLLSVFRKNDGRLLVRARARGMLQL